uniref:NET domain-containing protein n=1 Tax=Gongylonema pulchrum TaxID=637853 RepID=A0A183DUT6_9BILA
LCCYDEAANRRAPNSMGLGILIYPPQPTSMESNHLIIENGCNGGDVSGDHHHHLEASLGPSTRINKGLPSELKEVFLARHPDLRLKLHGATTPDDVPTDPFVTPPSVHAISSIKIRSAPLSASEDDRNGSDSSACPHDPEPSAEFPDTKDIADDGPNKQLSLGALNGECTQEQLNGGDASSINGVPEETTPEKAFETLESVAPPVRVPVPDQEDGGVAAPQRDVSEQEKQIHKQRENHQRALAASMSPNNYGPAASQLPSLARVQKQQLKRKSPMPFEARDLRTPSERSSSTVSNEDLQQKKPKLQENSTLVTNNKLSRCTEAAAVPGDDQLRIPNEKTLNRALDLFRKPAPVIATPTQDPGIGTSSKQNTKQRTQPKKSATQKTLPDNKEGMSRKVLQEKIGRLRDNSGLALSVPHLERAHLNQLANLLQSFRDRIPINELLPKRIVDHVFEGKAPGKKDEAITRKITKRTEDRLKKYVVDPDATDSSSDEDEQMPSTSSAASSAQNFRNSPAYFYYRERVRLGCLDAKALCMEEDCLERRNVVYRRVWLETLRKQKNLVFLDNKNPRLMNGEFCTRCLPFDGSRRRVLKRRNSPAYFYYRERVRLGCLDAKALCMEEDCLERRNVVYRRV